MDINHQFVIAAYTLTWVIQLGYVCFVVVKWRREKQMWLTALLPTGGVKARSIPKITLINRVI